MNRLDERMPWPEDYFGLRVINPSTLAPRPERRTVRKGASLEQPIPLADLTVRDMQRIRWARGAGLLGAIYGGAGKYLIADPGPATYCYQQGRCVDTAGLRGHLRRLESAFEVMAA